MEAKMRVRAETQKARSGHGGQRGRSGETTEEGIAVFPKGRERRYVMPEAASMHKVL